MSLKKKFSSYRYRVKKQGSSFLRVLQEAWVLYVSVQKEFDKRQSDR